MTNTNTNESFDQKKNIKAALNEARARVEQDAADLVKAASKFGPVASIEEIETLKITDQEDLISISQLLELKTKAVEIIERKRSLEHVILLEPSKLHEAVDAAEQLLVKFSDEQSLYQRSGSLVRVTKLTFSPQQKQRHIQRPNDAVIIKEIDQPFLTVLLTKLGSFMRLDSRPTGSLKKTDCPEKIARYLLAQHAWKLPILTGIINTPTLRSDGSILDTHGYDILSGMLFVPGDCKFEKIPEQPTAGEIEKAKQLLLHLIKDFPFEDEVSKSVAMAAILTVLIRKSLATAPLFGFSAPSMSSGKSLLADVVSLIATGRPNSVIAQADTEAEEKKRLMAILIEGDPIVCYDNIERPFGTAALCSILTQREYKDRILGGSETRSVLTNTTFLATGNNLTFVGDISTRTLLCKLDPKVEYPEERSFDVNLHHYVPENRGHLVRAALIILRAYNVAGKPKQDIKPFGRFEEWSDLVRSALVWIKMADPCESRREIENADPVRLLLGSLLTAWHEQYGDTSIKIKELVTTAIERNNAELLEILKELAGDSKGIINQRSLAKKLASFKNRIENGIRLEQMPPNQGTSLWRVKKI